MVRVENKNETKRELQYYLKLYHCNGGPVGTVYHQGHTFNCSIPSTSQKVTVINQHRGSTM